MGRNHRSRSLRVSAVAVAALVAAATGSWQLLAQAPEPAKGVKFAQVSAADMKEWLTYLSSDELQGRQMFTEGYGLAAQLHRRPPEGLGREADRRRRHVLPDRQAEGLQGHAQLDRDG